MENTGLKLKNTEGIFTGTAVLLDRDEDGGVMEESVYDIPVSTHVKILNGWLTVHIIFNDKDSNSPWECKVHAHVDC